LDMYWIKTTNFGAETVVQVTLSLLVERTSA
jgi:hypothetical protein